MADSRRKRQASGGYNFGGYEPGKDYTPRKPAPWKTILAVILIVGLIAGYAIVLL